MKARTNVTTNPGARQRRTPEPHEIARLRAERGMASLAADDDPAMGFVGIASLRQAADALERYQVARARDAGWTWAEIGNALGVSAQAAHKKHAGDAS